jgi:Ser/Thr protein kinase RdoA (MazF antagonist)
VFSGITSGVTDTPASVSTPPVGLIEAVGERYRLGVSGPTERLEGGYENDLFLVGDGSRRYVVRVEVGPAEPAGLAWEHAFVTALAKTVREVVTPFAAADGSTFFLHEGRAVSVLPFVNGRPADRDRDWEAAARMLGRLHRAAARIDMPPRPGQPSLYDRDWSLPAPSPEVPAALVEAGPRIKHELARSASWLRRTRLPCGPIHGDYYRGNLLVSKGRVVGLVDWRESHVDAWAYELANGIWEFCKAGDDFDRRRAARFANAYRSEGGVVAPAHDVHLESLMRCRRLVELTWALSEPRSGDWDWGYDLHNLRALDNLG